MAPQTERLDFFTRVGVNVSFLEQKSDQTAVVQKPGMIFPMG